MPSSRATDISAGLAYLHEEGILHRDLKSLNVLLTDTLRAKLSDFGLSRVKDETRSASTLSKPSGTLRWMAPENFSRKAKYTEASDVYSLGIILYQMNLFLKLINTAQKNFIIFPIIECFY